MTPRTRRIVIAVTALLIAALVGSRLLKWTVSTYGPVYTDEEYETVAPLDVLVDSFIEVALTSDFDPPGKYGVIKKWPNLVRYAFFQEFPAWHRDVALAHIELMSRLTGLNFEQVGKTSENIDLHLYFERDRRTMIETGVKYHFRKDAMEDLTEHHKCFALVRWRGANMLKLGIVVIGREETNSITTRCIIEELTQVIGPSADKAAYRPSIFSNEGILNRLSVNDMILVRTFYDPRIKPGMTRRETEPIARAIIGELVAAVKAGGIGALYQR